MFLFSPLLNITSVNISLQKKRSVRGLDHMHLKHPGKYLDFMWKTWGWMSASGFVLDCLNTACPFRPHLSSKRECESCLFGLGTIRNLVKVAGWAIGLWLWHHEALISRGRGISPACSSLIEVLSEVRDPVLSWWRALTLVVTKNRAFDKAHVMSEVSHWNCRRSVDLIQFTRFFSALFFFPTMLPSACSHTCLRLWKILAPLRESFTRCFHLEGFTVKPWYEWGPCKNKQRDHLATLWGLHSSG